MHVDENDGPADDRHGAESDDLSAHLLRRYDEIDERLRQLHERERDLAGHPTDGSTPQDLARAREHSEQAHTHAREAHENAGRRYEQAAAVHLRTADMLDQHGRSDRAREHREAAAADQAAGADQRESAEQEE
jgi:translation initiation factor 2B subunit (eIF-2B alpha/beta/delta family)